MSKVNKLALIPVMLCFFCMGFVDLVGIASNYVKEDLALNDSTANIFPSLVFFWFLIFSVPTGMLMNKIGRKKTVLLSLGVTVLSLLIPLFGNNFAIMLISFSLLGIGNALMQTSLNPLVSTVMGGGNLASTLTFGQFIKAIASFLAPYLALINCPKVSVEARLPPPITVDTSGFSEVCIRALPIPNKEKEISMVAKLLPKRGISSDSTVTPSESSTVFLRPILFISIPVGTLKIRNQKNTSDGKMLAVESFRPRSSFT